MDPEEEDSQQQQEPSIDGDSDTAPQQKEEEEEPAVVDDEKQVKNHHHQEEEQEEEDSSHPAVVATPDDTATTTAFKQPVEEEEEEEAAKAVAAAPPPTTTTKKISAKEYIQHVKNLKRRIAELEDQINASPPAPAPPAAAPAPPAAPPASTTRSQALAGLVSIALAHSTRHALSRRFHQWHAHAVEHTAGAQLERLGQLANRANGELDQARAQLADARGEKLEADSTVKRLKQLLQRAKQQAAEAKLDQCPFDGFSSVHVLRKLAGPGGEVFCMIQTSPPTTAPVIKYEFRPLSTVLTWLGGGDTDDVAAVQAMATVEDEFASKFRAMQAEMEMALATAQAQLEAEQLEFKQFQMRAELAFERHRQQEQDAGGDASSSSTSSTSASIIASLQQELVRTAAERDEAVLAAGEARQRMDAVETVQAQLKVREQRWKQELEALEHQLEASQDRHRQASRQQADKLDQAVQRQQEDMDVERDLRRKLQADADAAARLARDRDADHQRELQSLQGKHHNQVLQLEDKIRVLEAQHRARSSSAVTSTPQHQQQQQLPPMRGGEGTPLSTTSSRLLPRGGASPSPRSSRLPPRTFSSGGEDYYDDQDDGEDDAEDGSDSVYAEPFGSASSTITATAGSKYFVDQMGAIRAQMRAERMDWQRERAQLKQQMEDSVRRKDDGQQRIAQLERQIASAQLDAERSQTLLASSSPSSSSSDGLVYLKNCVFRFITADDDSERETLLPVITMLLKFSPQEVQALSMEAKPSGGGGGGNGGKGLLGGLFSRLAGGAS